MLSGAASVVASESLRVVGARHGRPESSRSPGSRTIPRSPGRCTLSQSSGISGRASSGSLPVKFRRWKPLESGESGRRFEVKHSCSKFVAERPFAKLIDKHGILPLVNGKRFLERLQPTSREARRLDLESYQFSYRPRVKRPSRFDCCWLFVPGNEDLGQCESRATRAPLLPTRKSRSAP